MASSGQGDSEQAVAPAQDYRPRVTRAVTVVAVLWFAWFCWNLSSGKAAADGDAPAQLPAAPVIAQSAPAAEDPFDDLYLHDLLGGILWIQAEAPQLGLSASQKKALQAIWPEVRARLAAERRTVDALDDRVRVILNSTQKTSIRNAIRARRVGVPSRLSELIEPLEKILGSTGLPEANSSAGTSPGPLSLSSPAVGVPPSASAVSPPPGVSSSPSSGGASEPPVARPSAAVSRPPDPVAPSAAPVAPSPLMASGAAAQAPPSPGASSDAPSGAPRPQWTPYDPAADGRHEEPSLHGVGERFPDLYLHDLVGGIILLAQGSDLSLRLDRDQRVRLRALWPAIRTSLSSGRKKPAALDEKVRRILRPSQKLAIRGAIMDGKLRLPTSLTTYLPLFEQVLDGKELAGWSPWPVSGSTGAVPATSGNPSDDSFRDVYLHDAIAGLLVIDAQGPASLRISEPQRARLRALWPRIKEKLQRNVRGTTTVDASVLAVLTGPQKVALRTIMRTHTVADVPRLSVYIGPFAALIAARP